MDSTSSSYQASSNAAPLNEVMSKKDRRAQLAKLFIVAFVSIGIVALTVFDVIQTAKSLEKKIELTDKIHASIDAAMLIHSLQKERGMTALYSTQSLLNSDRRKLRQFREKTDETIVKLKTRNSGSLDKLSGGKEPFVNILKEKKRIIDEGEASTIEILKKYREWIDELISTLAEYLRSENAGGFANLVYAYELLIMSKEEAGMERALGGLRFIEGKNFSHANKTWYIQKSTLAQQYLRTGFLISNEMKDIHSSVFANRSHLMKEIERKRKVLFSESHTEPSKEDGLEWFDLMTKYNNALLELQRRQADMINAMVDKTVAENANQLVIRSMLLCFTLIIVPAIILSLGRVQKHFYEYTLSLFDKVGLEQARTDFLMRQNSRYIENLSQKWRDFSNQNHSASSSNRVAPNAVVIGSH
ncbi:uncharacterized protein LOC114515621 [Dendronephthya gigantea]|uniref:uncharacterized protein LOC114515621 n=1 Tax=Dendronephthya gigantea TaxID=151771 RepID=UPI00106DC028|nr:uncharacterized protein LOC114515621 [Dendronephthya gigantea]